jgi:lysozyme family protein
VSAAVFEKAFQHVLKVEGGLVNHPSDPGGLTKYGISQRSYPYLDIRNLTVDQARAIYLKDFWLAAQCDLMPRGIDVMLFDAAVNHGPETAKKLLQQAAGVKPDGNIGPITLSAAAGRNVLMEFAIGRALKYSNTKNFLTFGAGWIRRVFTVYEFAKSIQESA